MKQVFKVLAAFLALAVMTQAVAMAQDAQTIKVKGEGVIFNNDKALAKDKAIEDALRKAVEQVAGTLVSSSTLVDNFVTVEDKIYAQSRGYVQKHRVLSERVSDGVFIVDVEATVAKSALKKDLDSILAGIVQRKEFPRMLLLISEQNIDQKALQGAAMVFSMSAVENKLIDELSPIGFTFVDPQVLSGRVTESMAAGLMAADSGAQVQAARQISDLTDAQVIVLGQAVATNAGNVMEGVRLQSGQADVNVRVINADNGQILLTASTHAAAAHINASTAGTKALQKAAVKLSGKLKEKLAEKWASSVGTITLDVTGITGYQDLVLLKQILQNMVRGVKGVTERRMRKDGAMLDVFFDGKSDFLAAELTGKKFDLKFEILEKTANRMKVKISR